MVEHMSHFNAAKQSLPFAQASNQTYLTLSRRFSFTPLNLFLQICLPGCLNSLNADQVTHF